MDGWMDGFLLACINGSIDVSGRYKQAFPFLSPLFLFLAANNDKSQNSTTTTTTTTTMMMMMLQKLLVALWLLAGKAWSMTDKATGIGFAPHLRGDLTLLGVGVRKKGPIRVYAVGVYCSTVLKEKLGTLSRSVEKGKAALAALREGAKEEPCAAFLLQMSFKVGAEKISAAIADSVATRYSEASEVDSLKTLIFNGVSAKGAATKGTTFLFDCTANGIEVAVDGSVQGKVESVGLAKAFCDVYLDDKCVSPALKESCLENCCAP